MAKRERLEIIKDILMLIKNNYHIKPTPLLRKSNLSTTRFKKYYQDLLNKEFLLTKKDKNGTYIEITEKGKRYLEKYRNIIGFIQEFEL